MFPGISTSGRIDSCHLPMKANEHPSEPASILHQVHSRTLGQLNLLNTLRRGELMPWRVRELKAALSVMAVEASTRRGAGMRRRVDRSCDSCMKLFSNGGRSQEGAFDRERLGNDMR